MSVLPAYVPGTVEVGWEIWVGAAAGVIPFAIGAYEFGKRIVRTIHPTHAPIPCI